MSLISRAVRRATLGARKRLRFRDARRLGIVYVPPNVVYRDAIGPGDVVVDVGCAGDADFSKHMIHRHGAMAWGVDPTHKHASALARLETELHGRFRHLAVAVAARPGRLTFHESESNVSGSLLADHVNVVRDAGREYEVEAMSLDVLVERIGADRVAILKLDLEGAEYELLGEVRKETLAPFAQLFIEFHHHAVPRYSEQDTWAIVRRLEGLGFSSFTLDDHNFVLFREGLSSSPSL
ncbi:MAG: FkbM family methyltransferase [Longimicrobiales bacterium]